jgi:serine/threonine protein kinase
MAVEIGQVIDGKYRIAELLGRGGMGAVYAAEHLVIGKRVAVKVLHGAVAENQNAVARFEREAQAAGRIGNDHIIEVFDFGSLPDGSRYMVCEFLEGETLAARIAREQTLSPAAMIPIVRQLLNGLGAAHAAGVVHRDLKPENVFLLRHKAGWNDFVKIIDFGISKFQPHGGADSMQMTSTGTVVGTPCYLSPEQARGSKDADARSDIYAVGVMLYEAVSGVLPFRADNVNELLFKIVLESPTPLLQVNPGLDPDFCSIVEMAMSRSPENRFPSAAEFAAALEDWAVRHGISVSGPTVTSSGSSKVQSGGHLAVTPTPGTWADSQFSPIPFKRQSHTKRNVAIGASIVLLAGAGVAAFAALRSTDAMLEVTSTTASGSASAPPPKAAAPTVEATLPAAVPTVTAPPADALAASSSTPVIPPHHACPGATRGPTAHCSAAPDGPAAPDGAASSDGDRQQAAPRLRLLAQSGTSFSTTGESAAVRRS